MEGMNSFAEHFFTGCIIGAGLTLVSYWAYKVMDL